MNERPRLAGLDPTVYYYATHPDFLFVIPTFPFFLAHYIFGRTHPHVLKRREGIEEASGIWQCTQRCCMSTETTANKVLKRGNYARDRRKQWRLALGFKFRNTPISEGEDISQSRGGQEEGEEREYESLTHFENVTESVHSLNSLVACIYNQGFLVTNPLPKDSLCCFPAEFRNL